MPEDRPRVLFVTDLTYQARGRRYCDEDIALSDRLRADFEIALCHPADAASLMGSFDVVLIRNSGPVIHYRAVYDEFRRQASATGVRVLSELRGKADMAGKTYLLELYAAGYPVIPTADSLTGSHALPRAEEYVAKPVFGADSVGLRLVGAADLDGLDYSDLLVQPRIDFVHEISFYFVDRTFQYALHAPDPAQRWALAPYETTGEDRAFAQRFVDWNDLDHGIQRVDACRTRTGELLLVELEDLNPYLSLDLVDAGTRDRFVGALTASLRTLASTPWFNGDRPPRTPA
ncbi:MAG: hypothetical protein NTV23_15820 [Propionibacteriales bacterium]|nr:hypothetical protein [Propionibacteriales bacterium]